MSRPRARAFRTQHRGHRRTPEESGSYSSWQERDRTAHERRALRARALRARARPRGRIVSALG
eukprot:5293966-Pleurochrysis_carterae.AAC.1